MDGYVRDGYLLPTWVAKGNSSDDLPHGPKLYSDEHEECWVCAINAGRAWHR